MVNDGFMNLAAEYPSRAAWTWQTPTRVYVPDGEWRRGSCRQLWIGLIRLGGIGAMGWGVVSGVGNVGHGLVDARSRQCLFPMI
jgi:hypothetical protein